MLLGFLIVGLLLAGTYALRMTPEVTTAIEAGRAWRCALPKSPSIRTLSW